MVKSYSVNQLQRLFFFGSLALLAATVISPVEALAGFNVYTEQALDGQTTDWITITTDSNGHAGLGTLHGGTLNVGVEGQTNIGNLRISNGAVFNADQIGAGTFGNEQYQGTINVGRYLIINDGGQMFLNGDALNVLGWSGVSASGNTTLSQDSYLSAINSTLNVANSLNLYGTSSMALSSGSIVNSDWLGLGGTNTLAVDNSTLNITNRFGVGLGTGDSSVVNLTGSTVNAGSTSILDNAVLTSTGSNISFKDDSKIENATMILNAGSLTFGDLLFVRGADGSLIINNATIQHQNLGDVDNRGALVVHEGGQFTLNNSTLNLVSGSAPDHGQRVTVKDGGQVVVTDSTISTRAVGADNAGSLYQQTGGVLNTHNLSSADGGEVRLNSTSVNATGQVTANGLFNATNTTLNIADVFASTDGVASLTDSTLSAAAGSFSQISHLEANNTTLDFTGSLNLHGGTSSMAMSNGSILNANEFGLGGTNTLNVDNSTLNITNRFGVGLGTGDSSVVTLTNSTVNAGNASIRDNATVTATGSNLMFQDDASIENATITQTGGNLAFGDELVVRAGGSLSFDNATVQHQDLGDIDNRGAVVVTNGGQLELNNSTLNLVSGGAPDNGQRVTVNTGGQVVMNTSTMTTKDVTVSGSGSLTIVTDSTLTTESLRTNNGGVFEETSSTINVTGNTTRIENGGRLTLNGGTYNEAGDFILLDSMLDGIDPILNIGGDLEVSGSSDIVFGGVAELFIGDDLLFDADTYVDFDMDSVLIYMQGTSDDEGNGNILDLDDSFLLGGLNVEGSADLVLRDNLLVNDLNFLGLGSINLNGFDLTVASTFSGDLTQIITSNGGSFNYDTNAPVPEPATMLLFGTGLAGLVGSRLKKKK